jgi:site-specific recombinase XerD
MIGSNLMEDDNQAPRSLPIEHWPTSDRAAWLEACNPSVRLKRGGAASHMRPVTRNDLGRRYGYFLDFLSRSCSLDTSAEAAAHVTPENVDAFITELKARVSSVTVYGTVHKLRRITQLIAPDRDPTWLVATERDLASEMRPRSKWGRVVFSQVLFDAGVKLMCDAEKNRSAPKLTRARLVRDGLMIALLAQCPIRLKNLAALEIGKSFLKVDDNWWIVLTAAETKEKRPDERPVPNELTEYVDRYLQIYRPLLSRGNTVSNALWISHNGNPLSHATIAVLIPKTVESITGKKVSPHLFRTAGVTTLATHAGDQPYAGGALLHHRPGPVTQENYNRASSITAAKAYSAITRSFRRQ